MYRKIIVTIMCIIGLGIPSYTLKGIEQQPIVQKEIRLEDDFFTAINQSWLDTVAIKEGYPSVSNFTELSDQTRNQLYVLFKDLEKNQANYKNKSIEKKMINLYTNYLNKKERNQQGTKPIEPYLMKIKQVKTLQEFNELLQEEPFTLFNPLYQLAVTTDIKNSKKPILAIEATSLHLNDTDDYLHPTQETLQKEEAIKNYLNKLLVLAGYTEVEARHKVEDVFQFEKALAPHLLSTKDITTHPNIYEEVYNPYTQQALDDVAPHLHLSKTIKKLGYGENKKILVEQPRWLEAMNSMYTDTSLEQLKNVVEVHLLECMAAYMSEAYGQAIITLEKELYGVEGQVPVEQEAFELVSATFPDEIGRLYVEAYFSKEEKKDVEVLVGEIIETYKKRIHKLDWMSDKTKEQAIQKLEHMGVHIGYPNKWESYKKLNIKSYEEGGNLVENVIAIVSERKSEDKKKLKQKVDKDKFLMSPQTVNACYSPTQNTITFPAAILQPPFYDVHASKEENLGGIGAVIAHEITHAFDHHGARFDEEGNLNNWWTEEDYKEFDTRADAIRKYYNTIEVLPGKYINGDLTVGENIADIGAMACVLEVLEEEEQKDYKALFESWAKIWRVKTTDRYQIQLLNNDPHAPNKARVNQVLMQFQKFMETYNIQPNDEMFLEEEKRLSIW